MARSEVASEDFSTNSVAAFTQLNPLWGNMSASNERVHGAGTARAPGDGQAMRHTSGTFADDQYSVVELSVISYLSLNYNIGVICRASADTDGNRDFYFFTVSGDAGGPNYTTTLGKVVNGTVTNLHQASAAWVVTDTIELECEGTTIRALKNGTELGGSWTQTDSDLSSGNAGLIGAGGTGTVEGDNWAAGDLVAAGVPGIEVHRFFPGATF